MAFDDKELIRNKAFFVREHDMLGVIVDDLDSDDPKGDCSKVKFPMVTEIYHILKFPRKLKFAEASLQSM